MLFDSIISQGSQDFFDTNKNIVWNAPTSGNYPTLPGIQYLDLWNPVSEGVETYNHHPFVHEFNNELHFIHSTTNSDEENPGEYVRYTKCDLDLTNQSAYYELFEPQDDLAKDRSLGGRVCVPSGFVVIDGELYGMTDVNDRLAGGDPRPRVGVGELIRKINMNETFGAVTWIEDIDGTLVAPSPLSGYPSYLFDLPLRSKVRNYFINNPSARGDWYYSVPDTDYLDTFRVISGIEVTEPRVAKLPIGDGFMKVWRTITGDTTRKYVQFSQYGFIWGDLYKTGIPDSPSRTNVLKLKNGNIAFIGNNEGGLRSPLFFALSGDGLTIDTANVYNIDVETGGANFSGFGKGTGVQYPHAIEMSNGKIACVYSVNKEDIRCAIFDIPEIV